MSESTYGQTGFPSACAEYAEASLSLDSFYLTNPPAMFHIQVNDHYPQFDLRKGDKLIIDRSLHPLPGDLVVAVISNEFKFAFYQLTPKGAMLMPFQKIAGEDELGEDFIWGVVASLHRKRR